jgi:hypothetical protein
MHLSIRTFFVAAICSLTLACSAGGASAVPGPGGSPHLNPNLPNPAGEPFSVSLKVGQRDVNGNFIGGTELINIVDFGGKLYAGNGYWEDTPSGGDPASAPQVLVLDSPHGQWRQDHEFSDTNSSGQFIYLRVTTLEPITFTTDSNGVPIAPVTMLAVGLDRQAAGAGSAVFTRNGDGTWTQLTIPGPPLSIRAMAAHKDAITGVDEFFIGAGRGEDDSTPGAIFRGVYDPTSPGRIRITATEFTGFVNRVMAFTEVNGRLLFAAKPGLYARTDGSATWSMVASVPPPLASTTNSGLRGLTVVGAGSFVLGGLEGNGGPILRFDPTSYSQSSDIMVGDILQTQWGFGQNQYIISAYNDMPQVTDPRTGNPVNLMGLQAHNPNRATSAWYLVRDASGKYTLHEVPALTSVSPAGLVAVRTIHLSPFAEDMGRVLYMGGYDADYKPAHNSAWLYRVGMQTALAPPAAQSSKASAARH